MNGRKDGRLKVSVVIPSWNDAQNLAELLPALRRIDHGVELIVVDAAQDREWNPGNTSGMDGKPDELTSEKRVNQSEKIAARAGAIFISSSYPSRGEQMNCGAGVATGEVLVFHHADAQLTTAHFAAIDHALRDPEIIGGAFHRGFDSRHPHLKFVERIARFIARHGGTLFGDQSIFVRREVFRELGGFAAIPLMEDVEFSGRLRSAGRLAIVDPPVKSSARRHLERGAWRASIQNALFIVLYKLGVSPNRLHRWYYGEQTSTT